MNLKTFNPAGFASALAVLSATAVVSTAAPAKAFAPVTFGYDCATGTTGAPCTVGQNQFRTTVSQGSQANQVLFTFINKLLPGGSQASSITGISFIDTPLRSLGKILAVNNNSNVNNSNGSVSVVNFTKGSTSNLTGGGRSYSFNSTGNKPTQIYNGVNEGETLSILFEILPGFANPIDAVITDLQDLQHNGGLGIALTAGGFSGQSVEFRAHFHNSAVPEPLTMLGSGAALGVGALLKKKGSQSKKQKAQVS